MKGNLELKTQLANFANERVTSIADIRKQLEVWNDYYFGKQPAYRSLLGCIEELGELAHAQLKMEQGIRNVTILDKEDAMADFIIYLLNYCNTTNYNLFEEDITTQYNKIGTEIYTDNLYSVDCIFRIQTKLSNIVLFGNIPKQDNISKIIAWTIRYCDLEGIDFKQKLFDTWERVKLRNWITYPINGINK